MKVYGQSDDLIEVEGVRKVGKRSWVTAAGYAGDEFSRGRIQVGDRAGGLIVKMAYGKRAGVWSACVEQIDEEVPIPWPVSITVSDRGYSVIVNIDCPDGVPVQKWRKPMQEGP